MANQGVARLGDTGSHGGVIITGASTIIVNDRPMARVGDMYACPIHGNNPIISGVQSVFGEGMLVAHVGSMTACGATITNGSQNTIVDDSTSMSVFPESVIINANDEEKKEILKRINEKSFFEKALNLLFPLFTLKGKALECAREELQLIMEARLLGFAHSILDIDHIAGNFSFLPGASDDDWNAYIDREQSRKNDFILRVKAYQRKCR